MTVPVIMPGQGQSVESCIISGIRKKKGDSVAVGDILFVYETDKATFEEEAKADGIMLDFFFSEGEEVPVLTNVCVIGAAGESVDEFRPGNAGAAQGPVAQEEKPGAEAEGISSPSPKEVPEPQGIPTPEEPPVYMPPAMTAESTAGISPRARELAARKGVSASGLKGSGPQGRIIERDVLEALEKGKATPLAKKMMEKDPSLQAVAGAGLAGMITGRDLKAGATAGGGDFEIKPLTTIRKLIAKAMHQSLQNSAQLTHHLGADARRITTLRKIVKKAVAEGKSADITLNDMTCYATISALRKFPQANAHLMGDSVKLFSKVHLGVAVDTDRGLMVPVIRNADSLTYDHRAIDGREATRFVKQVAVEIENLDFKI